MSVVGAIPLGSFRKLHPSVAFEFGHQSRHRRGQLALLATVLSLFVIPWIITLLA